MSRNGLPQYDSSDCAYRTITRKNLERDSELRAIQESQTCYDFDDLWDDLGSLLVRRGLLNVDELYDVSSYARYHTDVLMRAYYRSIFDFQMAEHLQACQLMYEEYVRKYLTHNHGKRDLWLVEELHLAAERLVRDTYLRSIAAEYDSSENPWDAGYDEAMRPFQEVSDDEYPF